MIGWIGFRVLRSSLRMSFLDAMAVTSELVVNNLVLLSLEYRKLNVTLFTRSCLNGSSTDISTLPR